LSKLESPNPAASAMLAWILTNWGKLAETLGSNYQKKGIWISTKPNFIIKVLTPGIKGCPQLPGTMDNFA
ncbi:unnamed protein product, partial [marine sediment metagenome]